MLLQYRCTPGKSMSEHVGPRLQPLSRCSIVCFGAPQLHSLFGVIFHLWRVAAVRPTFDLALFRATHSFLSRLVPHASVSVGCWTASVVLLSHSFHCSILDADASFGFKLLAFIKLLRDLSLFFGGTWPKRVCLGSYSCLNFCVLVLISRRMCGGAMPASL